MTRIALLNVKYSPNLGDGVIAECLENELARVKRGWQVQSIDLAGRETFGSGLDAGRDLIFKFLDTLPLAISKIALRVALTVLVHMKYRPAWRRKLAGTDCVLVGGGQLIADADLNFPIKLGGALTEVARLRRPVAVFGVGVSGDLSGTALRIFDQFLRANRIAHVAVRDAASQDSWDRQLASAGIPRAELCRDPGLLAADLYPPKVSPRSRTRPLVGIGIVNPRTLYRHSADGDAMSIEDARQAWVNLAMRLMGEGFDVSLFTNGPHDDEEFLNTVLDLLADTDVGRSERPYRPSQLAETIQDFDAIISHRLHANILAYAFGIPHIGCAWDPKLEAFFASVGREDFIVELGKTEPGDICELLATALQQGIDPVRKEAVIAETRKAIEDCAIALTASLDPAVTASGIRAREYDRDAACPG